MSKGKKNWLMILIYAGLIAMCLGIVWFVGKISSPTKPGRESSSETTMVQTGESQEEEREEEESESAEARRRHRKKAGSRTKAGDGTAAAQRRSGRR